MPHKLLLADDSVTIQRVIELTFADEDMQVFVVGDGRQAIDRIQADRPDIVLADVGMPERDGYEVAAFVKNHPQLAHIPVVLLTGAFEPIDEGRARSVGCDAVLVKPFEPQLVISRVKELLAARRTALAAMPSSTSVSDESVQPTPAQQPQSQPAVPPAAEAVSHETGSPAPAAAEPVPQQPGAPATGPVATPSPVTDARADGESLDAYFDRLDAAFAALTKPRHRPGDTEDLRSRLGELEQAPLQRDRGEDPMTGWDPELAADFPPTPSSHLASAFAALLTAEQGGAPRAPSSPPPAALSEDSIEEIVRRVLARMADDSMRQLVVETAERLVREEIERIKRG